MRKHDNKLESICVLYSVVVPRVQLGHAGLRVRSVGNRGQSCKYHWNSEHKSLLLNSEHQTALTDTHSLKAFHVFLNTVPLHCSPWLQPPGFLCLPSG